MSHGEAGADTCNFQRAHCPWFIVPIKARVPLLKPPGAKVAWETEPASSVFAFGSRGVEAATAMLP